MESKLGLTNVHDFWNTEACDTHVVKRCSDDKDFYEQFREYRYRTQWHIPLLVPFAAARGKTVLEIGTGNGADGAMFALNGAIYTGVDLTEAALEATRKHFKVLGIPGSFQQENAERLSFPAGSFDWVYSNGVLHHTPDTQTAIQEVWRVLKPGGQAIIMIYHKRSFNYFVRIMTYMRLRVLLKIMSRGGHWPTDRQQLASDEILGVRGNENRQVWDIHYRNFLKAGWRYLEAQNFIHHGTDGPECPIAYAFTKAEASRLFASFEGVQMKVAHFPIRRYSAGRWVPFRVEKFLASLLGWYLIIFATKPRAVC